MIESVDESRTIVIRLFDDGSMVRLQDGRKEPITPQVDYAKLDATTEADLARQEAQDEIALAVGAG